VTKTKKSDTKKRQNVKIILSAVFGMIFIAAYYFLVMQSDPVSLLCPQLGAEQHNIISKAESLKHQLFLAMTHTHSTPGSFNREIRPYIDKNLFKYAQSYKQQNGKFPDLAVASWRVTWQNNTPPKNTSKHNRFDFEVAIDFNNQITEFRTNKQPDTATKPIEFSEDDALIEAKSLLESLNISTKFMVITNKEFSKTNTDTTFTFTLKNQTPRYPNLTENYLFEMEGERITHFKKETVVNFAELGWNDGDKTDILDIIVLSVFFLPCMILVIIIFIKKLRRDQLEFKWAKWLGVLIGVTIALLIIFMNRHSLSEGLIGSIASGGFTFLGTLILFSVSEALSREVWPEKLAVVDLLFQRRGGVRETGKGILRSYFLTGSTVLMMGILIFATSTLNICNLSFKSELIGVFLDLDSTLATLFHNLIIPLLVGCLFLIFCATFLKKALPKHPHTSTLLLAIIFDLIMGFGLFFEPPWIEAILLFPIALLWAYAVQRWDHFTLLLSFFWTGFLLDLTLIFVMPHRVLSIPGLLTIILPVLVFILGVYLLFRSKSAKDYEVYVPEYVNRIAEKERFLKELEIARGVQMRFLPQKVPQSPSLEIVSLCQPAMEVGGDYFDFVQIDNRYMTVMIGDVSGKGVSAAFYMTMVKGIIKTLSKKTLKPATLLTEANEIFYENAPRDVFVTIIYGIFDLIEKTLTVASAGHNPLIVWRNETRKTELINPKGLALGLVKNERYQSIIEENCMPIHENDVFVFYTDGVSEAMNIEEDIFGEERLREVVETNAHLSPQQLQEKIVNTVAQFSGKAPQHDDFTMVVVKVRPQ